MNTSLGFAVATFGLVIMTVGVVSANIVFFRSLPLLTNRTLMRAAPIAVFEFAFWLVAWAAVALLGIATMLLGLVLTGGLVTWAPLVPLAPAVLAIPLALSLRWQINQLRHS